MYEDKKESLQVKAEELSHRITGGDGESMAMMDQWYDTIKELEKLNKNKDLVALSGKDLPLIEDYIDDKCTLIVPRKYFTSASRDMGPGPEEI